MLVVGVLGEAFTASRPLALLHVRRPFTATDDVEAHLTPAMDLIHAVGGLRFTYRLHSPGSTPPLRHIHRTHRNAG